MNDQFRWFQKKKKKKPRQIQKLNILSHSVHLYHTL